MDVGQPVEYSAHSNAGINIDRILDLMSKMLFESIHVTMDRLKLPLAVAIVRNLQCTQQH